MLFGFYHIDLDLVLLKYSSSESGNPNKNVSNQRIEFRYKSESGVRGGYKFLVPAMITPKAIIAIPIPSLGVKDSPRKNEAPKIVNAKVSPIVIG